LPVIVGVVLLVRLSPSVPVSLVLSGVSAPVGVVVVEALLRPHPSEDRLGGMEKLRRFELARKVHETEKTIDLPVEDVALIKELIGTKNFPVLIVGQMFGILEGKK
jgi:hypothetical protein